jgi:hypothetical protein
MDSNQEFGRKSTLRGIELRRGSAETLIIRSFTGSDAYEPSLPGLTRQSNYFE